MKLEDKVNNIQGYFSVKSYKKDGSVETYEDKNLIMDKARSNMAELIGGYNAGQPINKFVLGNKGHNGEDILDYKKVGENGEFISSNTKLFAELGEGTDRNNKEDFVYEITFDPIGSELSKTDTTAVGKIKDSTITEACEVSRLINGRTCTYTITIPDYAGNPVGEGSVVAYTEAALYAGDDIFSMKSFPARVKEDSVKLIVLWSLTF